MSRELDEQCARALGYATLWAEDSVFGPSLYLHDAGAVRESDSVTTNAHLLGANWERLRVGDAINWYLVRLCPAFSESHEAARILEDEIERRAAQVAYLDALVEIVLPYVHYELKTADIWRVLRATPEEKCRAFLKTVEETRAA